MNYGEAKAYLRAVINRRDITDDLAAQFIRQSQDRLERWPQVDPLKHAPRPKFMERYVYFSLDPLDSEPGAFRKPSDFLDLIALWTDNDVQLTKVDVARWLQTPAASVGTPRIFMETGHAIRVKPRPSEDCTFYMLYYGAEDDLTVDTDENYWTISCIDALVYGAAEYAADYFEDERLPRFTAKFQQLLGELQDQTIMEDFSGPMVIGPSYDFQDCD